MRLAVVCLVLVALGVPAFLMVWARSPLSTGRLSEVAQPVEFDHRHHVVDDGIDCRYCHRTADRAAPAGIPAVDVCMGCHSQVWTEAAQLEAVRRSAFGGAPLTWTRVHDLPDFAYFNHAVHVRGGVECQACHGRVDRMASVLAVAPLTMGWCLECHRAQGADAARLTTCTACHR